VKFDCCVDKHGKNRKFYEMLNMITVINSLYYVKRKMEMNANDVKRR